MKTITFVFALVMLIVISGCAVHKAPIDLDVKAKGLSAPKDKALVYIIRPSTLGSAVRGVINCDNNYLGSLAGLRYIFSLETPGKHVFTGLTENSTSLEVDLEAGKTYYILERMTMGVFYGRNKLLLLNEDDGKKGLISCKLSQDCVARL